MGPGGRGVAVMGAEGGQRSSLHSYLTSFRLAHLSNAQISS